jgi:oligoendopeptidase F
LEDLVRKEREDRIESLESQLTPIRKDLREIESGIIQERNARVQKEREILETLRDESAKIEEALTIEKEERLARQAELYARVTAEINRENQWIEGFQSRTRSEF